MGNAVITIHHPTSLDHGIPYMESGKIRDVTTSMIRLEKKDGAAVGCGGSIHFKKTVKDSSWTFKCSKTNNFGMEVGSKFSVKAAREDEAVGELAVKFSVSSQEMRDSVVTVASHIIDDNIYSELYVYVNYNGKNKGEVYWKNGNPLNLKFHRRWEPDSEMVVDVFF